MSAQDKRDLADRAISSETGVGLAGSVMTAILLARITDGDEDAVREAFLNPTAAGTAAYTEASGLPDEIRAPLAAQCQATVAGAIHEAIERLWTATHHLNLKNPQAIAADVVALVAATVLFGEVESDE